MKTITTVVDDYGTIEFRIKEDGVLEVKVDVKLPIPEGHIEFKGYLSPEEIAWNVQHSLLILALNNKLPFQLVDKNTIANYAPKDEQVN